jgi:hypothetical protein
MDIYKEAIMQDLKVQTTKGLLTPQQLCTLNVNELDSLAVELQEKYEQSGKKSFLIKRSIKDKKAKLAFDIVLDILQTKNDQEEAIKKAAEIKENNQKIFDLIEKKQDQVLESKSIKELKAMLQ